MNTLNEIRFDDKDLFFNDNIVKTSILPQGTKDLKRNIKVQANSVFEGSVFGNNVEIEDGGVIFKGAVFANTELHCCLPRKTQKVGNHGISRNKAE